MKEEFQAKDTSGLQGTSLTTFMRALGYSHDGHSSARFATDAPELQANRYLRFDTAQRLHNSSFEDWVEVTPRLFKYSKIDLVIALDAYALQQLFALKLVQKTKWLHTRKGGHKIALKSQMIKPAHSSFTRLFGLVA